mmetsp:Transcript_3918/g.8749  ORF Transcript_3918/g.8749 Transcript_3918/m.8749 type:complete len:554 (-) Transcript_3918:2494-4155(-)
MGYRKPPSKKKASQMFLIATLLILNIATFGLLYFADKAFFSDDGSDELEIRYLNTRKRSGRDQRGGQESEDQAVTIAREKNNDDTFITKRNETLQLGKIIHELGGYVDNNRVALEKRENALVVSNQYYYVNPDEQSVDPGQQLFHEMNELVDSGVIDEIKEGGGGDETENNSQIQPSQRDGELKSMTQTQEIKKKKKKTDYYYNATAREILLRTKRPKPGTSGVGLVTTDGQWGNIDMTTSDERNVGIKILGFTDWKYLHIAKVWYKRLNQLGYTEHFLAAHDEQTFQFLKSNNYRTIPCFIENPQYDKPVKGLWQQIMSARLRVTMALLKGGASLLISDVDNVFSRYVDLKGLLEEGYDVFHAYEMRYPVSIFKEFGFVVCSGFQFLRSSPRTIKFLELVLSRCRGKKCDDQVTYNEVFFRDLDIEWHHPNNYNNEINKQDGKFRSFGPNHEGALRITSNNTENDGLLVEGATGISRVTNHTIKIWDRDFAWRLAGDLPEKCPSLNNWVGMPTKIPAEVSGKGQKIRKKIELFKIWDEYCLNKTGQWLYRLP